MIVGLLRALEGTAAGRGGSVRSFFAAILAPESDLLTKVDVGDDHVL